MVRLVRHAPEFRSNLREPVLAALLHDVGMLRAPLDALSSEQRLTDAQCRALEDHPRAGSELILYRLAALGGVASAIATHHERFDGSGYPTGLRGEQIPLLARLLAVADTYAAMCCPRPFRPAADPRTALTDTLLLAEQKALDRFMAEKLLVLSFYPVGSVVELVDGAVGVVLANHHGSRDLRLAAKPIIAIVTDARGMILPTPQPADLAEGEGRTIVRTLRAEERSRLLGRHYPEWAI